jgi:hypothetical protein
MTTYTRCVPKIGNEGTTRAAGAYDRRPYFAFARRIGARNFAVSLAMTL